MVSPARAEAATPVQPPTEAAAPLATEEDALREEALKPEADASAGTLTMQTERSALSKWGHTVGSEWHLWPKSVIAEVGLGVPTASYAECNKRVVGVILYADRPVFDNSCPDCLSLAWLAGPDAAPEAEQRIDAQIGAPGPLPAKQRKPRSPQPCKAPGCSVVPAKVVSFCELHMKEPRIQRNQWLIDHDVARKARNAKPPTPSEVANG